MSEEETVRMHAANRGMWSRQGSLPCVAVLILASCASWAERDFRKEHSSCSEPLEVAALGDDGWFAVTRGCGKTQVRLLWTNGDPNGGGAPITEIVERFNFETKCLLKELSFKRLELTSVGISGCDYSAVYKYVAHIGWVTDSATGPGK